PENPRGVAGYRDGTPKWGGRPHGDPHPHGMSGGNQPSCSFEVGSGPNTTRGWIAGVDALALVTGKAGWEHLTRRPTSIWSAPQLHGDVPVDCVVKRSTRTKIVEGRHFRVQEEVPSRRNGGTVQLAGVLGPKLLHSVGWQEVV